jgi:predicted Zn-dependent peptidase
MRSKVRFTILAIVLTLAVPAFSQSLPPGVAKKATAGGITEYLFPNGLRVLLYPDQTSPKVTVNMTYLVGSRHEGYGETGMAHLLEHMDFIETTDGRQIKKEIVDHGAVWNGSTSYDRANYYETVTATDENLKWALGLEADRMVKVKFTKALLDTEMTVVRSEFERGENNPQSILEERVVATAYLWHNYGKSTIGSRDDIEKVPVDRLEAFYQKYYRPDNAVLVIAGQFDPAKALGFVADTVGKIPRPTRKLDQTYTVEPAQDGERFVELRRVGSGQEVMMAYHAPAAGHPDSVALQVLAGIMSGGGGGGGQGRLSKALVDTKKALSANMSFQLLHDPGFVLVSANLSNDQSLDDVKRFRDQFYGASHGELVIVGQCDRAALLNAAAELLGNWNSPAPYQRLATNYKKAEPINQKIETPDKANAQFEAGLRIQMSQGDPDYPAMILANYMFGGSITARMPDRIRNREGLSYGASSAFTVPADGDAAMFAATVSSNPANTPKVEASFKEELAKALQSGFTAEEVAAAKKAYLDAQRVLRSQDAALLSLLASRVSRPHHDVERTTGSQNPGAHAGAD